MHDKKSPLRARGAGSGEKKLCSASGSGLLDELLQAVQTFLQHVQRGAVGDADGVVVAEGDAGDSGHLVAGEELLAELEGAAADSR